MYNLSRKSVILAGIILLLSFSCKTVTKEVVEEVKIYNMETLFPKGRESFVYIDITNNKSVINSVATDLGLGSTDKKILNKSNYLYLATGYNMESGFDIVLNGEFSKNLYEFGLFFSLNWKSLKEDGIKYWLHKDGIKLAIIDNNTVIISTGNIIGLIDNLSKPYSIEVEKDDFKLFIPRVEKEFLTRITSGFIKNGINLISVSLKRNSGGYDVFSELGTQNERKAKALSRLLSIFIKLALSESKDHEIRALSKLIVLGFDENKVLVDNIHISEKKLLEILNNLIVNEGEADK